MPNDIDLGDPGENALVLEPGQDLVIKDENGNERLRLDANTGSITIRTAEGKQVVLFEAGNANLWMGTSGKDGDLLIFPATADSFEVDTATAYLNGDLASLRLGTATRPGHLSAESKTHRVELDGSVGRVRASGQVDVRTDEGELRVRLNANGVITAGGNGTNGQLSLRNSANENRISLNGASATADIGGNGEAGDLFIRDADDITTIQLNGATGNIGLGADDNAGGLFVKDENGKDIIVLNGATGNIGLGRDGNSGALFVKDNSGDDIIVLNGAEGNIGLGRDGNSGELFIKNKEGKNTIHLHGENGDIYFANADCAEEFDLLEAEKLEPGTVVVIREDEKLQQSDRAYDRCVAGVISGAEGYRPGIVLDKRQSNEPRLPLALMGKVYCKVDTQYGSIDVGDLLTTSSTPGHAMKALDPAKAFGAVIGKALRPFSNGQGLIPILIALQ